MKPWLLATLATAFGAGVTALVSAIAMDGWRATRRAIAARRRPRPGDETTGQDGAALGSAHGSTHGSVQTHTGTGDIIITGDVHGGFRTGS